MALDPGDGDGMIYGEHEFGVYNDLTIWPAPVESGGLIIVRVGDKADEALDRADVERLRNLCDEALS